jgi:hypothetical protein
MGEEKKLKKLMPSVYMAEIVEKRQKIMEEINQFL